MVSDVAQQSVSDMSSTVLLNDKSFQMTEIVDTIEIKNFVLNKKILFGIPKFCFYPMFFKNINKCLKYYEFLKNNLKLNPKKQIQL